MKILNLVERFIIKFIEIVIAVFTAALVIDVVWQVASRYVVKMPCSWSTEVATILLIWITLLGAAVAFARNGHLGFDYIVNKLSPANRNITEYLVLLSMSIFVIAVFICGGFRFVYLVFITQQMSPVLGIRTGYLYTVIPLAGIILQFFITKLFIEKILKVERIEKVEEEA